MHFTTLHLIELGLLAVAFVVLAFGAAQQVRHLSTVPRIDSTVDFDAFKGFVRRQMYLTLGFLLLVVPAIALIFVEDTEITLGQKVILWTPYGVIGLVSVWTKAREKRIRDVSRCAPEYREEFLAICHTWNKRMWPDF